DRALLDRPERLAGYAVEHIEEAELGGLRDDVELLAVVPHGEQLRRGRQIVIPEIVVDDLEMPEALAGAEVEGEKRIAEQVRSDTVRAVKIVRRTAEREVADGALL